MDIYMIIHIWSFFAIVTLIFSLLLCVSSSNIFKTNNQKALNSYIPIYNLICILNIVKLNNYYFILLVLPVTNVLLILYILYRLTIIHKTNFSFSLGLILLPVVFLPLLNHNLKTEEKEESNYKDIYLMSDEEIKNLNDEEEHVDNVFKDTFSEVKEEIPVFKANAVKYRHMMIDDDSLGELKTLKPSNVEKITSISNETSTISEDDNVEIIEL